MKSHWLWATVVICLILLSYEFGARHSASKGNIPVASKEAAPARDTKPEAKEADEYLGQVKVIGPLVNWIREAEENQGAQAQQEAPALAPAYYASELDRVPRRPASAPHNFVHATFPVKTYTAFEILIPPGLVSASLRGSFESFTYAAHQRQPADVEVLLLDDLQFTDFVHRNAGAAIYSINPCPRQSLKWLLNSDYHKTKKYYFLFHNPDSRRQLPSVKADFTVSFN